MGEEKEKNDIFFICSLIELIARKTNNKVKVVIEKLGQEIKILTLDEEIRKVYQRLIIMIDDNKESYIRNLNDVLSSWIIEKIDNYNSSLYYENPDYIYECYKEGKII